ncbi:244_t:CDS:2, partial [Ambispora leptoticha]
MTIEFLPYTKNLRASFANSRQTSSTHTVEYDDDGDSCAENSEEENEEFLFMSAFNSSRTEYRLSN